MSLEIKLLQTIDFMNARLSNIEKNISRLEEKLDFSNAISRNHLIRIKNGEDIDDSTILFSKPYNDLSPIKAYDIFSNSDHTFLILDVSSKDSEAVTPLEGSIRIPLEELKQRYAEIQSKTLPILIISELGLRSIQACELLVKKGYYNLSNISGGHQFWPANKSNRLQDIAI